MIAETASLIIASLCYFNSPVYTKDSKLECSISLANCAIVKHGVLADDKVLTKCTEAARLEFTKGELT